LLAVGLHTCTAVARSLCVSWAFLLLQHWLFSVTKPFQKSLITDRSITTKQEQLI